MRYKIYSKQREKKAVAGMEVGMGFIFTAFQMFESCYFRLKLTRG